MLNVEIDDELHVEWAAICDKLSLRAQRLFTKIYLADGEFGLTRPMPDILDLKIMQGVERLRGCGSRLLLEIRMTLGALGKRLPGFPVYNKDAGTPFDDSLDALEKREAELRVELTLVRQKLARLRRMNGKSRITRGTGA